MNGPGFQGLRDDAQVVGEVSDGVLEHQDLLKDKMEDDLENLLEI